MNLKQIGKKNKIFQIIQKNPFFRLKSAVFKPNTKINLGKSSFFSRTFDNTCLELLKKLNF